MDIVQNRVRPHPELRSYAPSRTHKIRDGDTLANIAQRMLGDAGRANELFELNRNVLPSPQLLPLGVEIKIPAMDGRAGTSPPGMTPVYMPRE